MIRALVSADAACAVGVEPTESTNGLSRTPYCGEPAKTANANPAAVFTASTSEDRAMEASNSEIDAYELPA